MLIGEYKSNITTGNRTALPKKLRKDLGRELVVSRGYEGCLIAVSHEHWKDMIADAASGPFVSKAVRDTTRFLLGSAHEVSLDAQGRFVVPSALLEYAGITEEVVFLGLGRWVEIWAADKWETRRDFIDKHGAKIAEKLAAIALK